MMRSLTATVGLLAALGFSPVSASAATMCADVSSVEVMSLVEAISQFEAISLLESQDDSALVGQSVVGGMSGISMSELVFVTRTTEDGDSHDVLWCQSADDPRCSPVPHDERGNPTIASLLLRSGGPGSDDVPAPSARKLQFPECVSSPRSGTRRRLDRPPRA